jgi:hypothetical protein
MKVQLCIDADMTDSRKTSILRDSNPVRATFCAGKRPFLKPCVWGYGNTGHLLLRFRKYGMPVTVTPPQHPNFINRVTRYVGNYKVSVKSWHTWNLRYISDTLYYENC